MKIFSALLDLALLPAAVAEDVVMAPVEVWIYGRKSQTRKKLEEIEEELGL